MSDSVPAADVPQPRPKRRKLKRLARCFAVYVLLPYVVIVVILALFQRSLIYQPVCETHVGIERARLPNGQVHPVTVTTHDGLTLNGWHILPDGRTAADKAECDRELARGGLLVLYFYGNAGSRVNDVHDCRDFTSLGCHVFLFDYRGYGDNEGSPSESGLAADASAVWKYAVSDRGVAPERILVFGQSLGGAVAIRLAAEACREGASLAGLVVCSTFSSMADVAQWHYPYFPVRLLLVDRFPSVERIGSIRCPFLSFHGTRDDIVPLEIGRKLFDSAPESSASSIAKRFVELPGAAHNDVPRRAFQRGVREFLENIQPSIRKDAPEGPPRVAPFRASPTGAAQPQGAPTFTP